MVTLFEEASQRMKVVIKRQIHLVMGRVSRGVW